MVTDSKGTEELISFIILPMSQRYLKARFKVKDNVLRTVPTIVIAHTFCASPDTRISYRQCLLILGYLCAV